MFTTPARRSYGLIEPISTAPFFAPETNDAFGALGFTPAAAYVTSRAAPMGRVPAAVVASAFYTFHPNMIRAHLRWDLADPETVLAARLRAATAATRRLIGTLPVDRAAVLLRRVVEACPVEGRILAAAHAALPWPEDEVAGVWHAATVLREHRGDGHTAVLVSHGISPAEALTLDVAYNSLKSETYVRFREFGDEEMSHARDHLKRRGYLAENGELTDGGGKFRQMLEMETDRLAAPAYVVLSEDEREELNALLEPITGTICEQRGVPRYIAALSAG